MAAVAESELHRLAALARYAVLDAQPESVFDYITELARLIYGAPAAAISLVDSDRIWFKSQTGIDVADLPRDPFCNDLFAIQEPLIINDMVRHPRCGGQPLGAALGGFRFYAGVPLRTPEGYCIGTLSVMDRTPRPRFLPADIQQLTALADIVIDKLELRLVRYEMAQTRRQVDMADRAKSEFLATMSHEVQNCFQP